MRADKVYFAFSSYFLTIEKFKTFNVGSEDEIDLKTLPLNYLENIILKLLCKLKINGFDKYIGHPKISKKC